MVPSLLLIQTDKYFFWYKYAPCVTWDICILRRIILCEPKIQISLESCVSICECVYLALGAGPFSTVWGAGMILRSSSVIWVVRRDEVIPIWSSANEYVVSPHWVL